MSTSTPAPPHPPSDTTRRIEEAGIVAILRADDARHFAEASRVLIDSGVTAIEITLTTAGALDAIAQVTNAAPDGVVVGAGSVITPAEAAACLEAGSHFLVSPITVPDVLEAGKAANIPVYPGAFTPTELEYAASLGAAVVKLFPASPLGPDYLSAVLGPMPDLKVMPTGGIAITDIATWVKAGACAVGLGGPLLGDALEGGDLRSLAQRAALAVTAFKEVAATRR